jgi:hypothetical protein
MLPDGPLPAPPAPDPALPRRSPPPRRGWWAPITQAVALVAIILTSAGVVDARTAAIAADVAADQGRGVHIALARPRPQRAAPVALSIKKIGLSSSLIDLRKNPNGTVQVPKDVRQVGWYVGSAHPGDAGPTVLIGHIDSYKGPGVFHRLPQLKKGDVITVTRADRSQALFTVQLVKRFSKRNFPTELVYRGDGKASLRLITCGGEFDRASGHYLDNTIVFAAPSKAPAKPAVKAPVKPAVKAPAKPPAKPAAKAPAKAPAKPAVKAPAKAPAKPAAKAPAKAPAKPAAKAPAKAAVRVAGKG